MKINEHEAIEILFKLLKEYRQDTESPFLDYKSPKQLATLLNLGEENTEGDFSHSLKWLKQYLNYGVTTNHPSFVNRMWAGANLPSIMGELAVAFSNTSACTYESAPVSTLMENYMIGEMLKVAGFKNGEGQMTTGSSNANMIAMMTARNLAYKRAKQDGLSGSKPLYGFVNADAHYSMDKAANILGIGIDKLIKVPVNKNGEMRIDLLEESICEVKASGGTPFFVAATVGTTVRGAYDSIEQVLVLKDKYDFWLHADGAWGGAAIMSDTLKEQYLKGIEHVDSFTCDFHKMLGSALMCNFLLINRGNQTFSNVLGGGDGSYLFRDSEDDTVPDLGNFSLQCGRRVDGLKWFLDWKYYGKEGFGKRMEKYLELCKYAEQLITETDELELVAPRTSFNLCFRYKAENSLDLNDFTHALRTRLYTDGDTMVGLAYVDKSLTMRLLICNQLVEKKDIRTFFEKVCATGRKLDN